MGSTHPAVIPENAWMGDTHHGENQDLGKTLTMAFTYSLLTIGSGAMAYRSRPRDKNMATLV